MFGKSLLPQLLQESPKTSKRLIGWVHPHSLDNLTMYYRVMKEKTKIEVTIIVAAGRSAFLFV